MANDSTCHIVRSVRRQTLRAREIINWVRCSSSSPVHWCTEWAMGSGVLSIPRCSKLQKAHSSVIQTSASLQRSGVRIPDTSKGSKPLIFWSSSLAWRCVKTSWGNHHTSEMFTEMFSQVCEAQQSALASGGLCENASKSESRPVLSDIKRGCNKTPEVGVIDFISRRPEFYSWDKMSRIHRVTCQTSTEH